MKIRNGFVSNSSSSSFLLIGVKIPYPEEKDIANILAKTLDIPEEDITKKVQEAHGMFADEFDVHEICKEWIWDVNFKEHGIDMISDREDEEWLIIGKEIGCSYNDSVETIDMDLTELIEHIEVVRDRIGLTDVPVQLYLGGLTPGY